jgi:response regulator RpfG family c-di-GMP phosphodiesterase
MSMGRVLVVDDDSHILSGYRRALHGRFDVDIANSGPEALRRLETEEPYAVVVSDLRMPGMDGVRFLAQAREIVSDTVRIMLTGQADLSAAIEAVNEGNIFRFLTKPCPVETLSKVLESAVRQYELVHTERVLLEETLRGSTKVLVDLLSMMNPDAFGRASRVQHLIRAMLHCFGRENAWELDLTAMLSQIGLVTLPPELVEKALNDETLTAEETLLFERHPQIAHDLLVNIPRLRGVAENIALQLKSFSGSGPPPHGPHGTKIPLGARLLRIVLDHDTLSRSGLTYEGALAAMRQREGCYDPDLLNLLQAEMGKMEEGYAFRILTMKQLASGMIVRDGIRTSAGVLLVQGGQEITPHLLARIQNFSRWQPLIEPVGVLVPVPQNG